MCRECELAAARNAIGSASTVSVDEVLRNADFVGLSAVAIGGAIGEFVHSKVKAMKWGNRQFRILLLGISKFIVGVYGNSASNTSFWKGFWAGFAASGIVDTLRSSGLPAFAGVWTEQFNQHLAGVVEDVRYKIGSLSPYKLPVPTNDNDEI